MNVAFRELRIGLVILGAVILALLLNWLIVTDKRRIERTLQAMADATGKGDVDLLFSHISADYRDDNFSRKDLKAMATDFLGRVVGVKPKIRGMTVNVSDTLARVEMRVSGTLENGDQQVPMGNSEWAVELRKEPGGIWRVTSIAPVRFWGRQVTGWHDLPRDYF
jgi:hypothetical protein